MKRPTVIDILEKRHALAYDAFMKSKSFTADETEKADIMLKAIRELRQATEGGLTPTQELCIVARYIEENTK